MYKWKDSFSKNNKVDNSFIKKIFSILNKGTAYNDLEGKFVGYINALEGPLGIIHFISDHSLTYDKRIFIIVKTTYLNKNVLYFVMDSERLTVYTFENGHWANKVQNFDIEVI